MKHLIIAFTILTMHSFTCYAMAMFEQTAVVITTSKIERFPAHMVVGQQPYVKGGLVFTYPDGLFTTSPTISLTIVAPLHVSNITYTVEVCLKSPTSTTVMAYQNISGVLTEAPTDSINIHFMAIGT